MKHFHQTLCYLRTFLSCFLGFFYIFIFTTCFFFRFCIVKPILSYLKRDFIQIYIYVCITVLTNAANNCLSVGQVFKETTLISIFFSFLFFFFLHRTLKKLNIDDRLLINCHVCIQTMFCEYYSSHIK